MILAKGMFILSILLVLGFTASYNPLEIRIDILPKSIFVSLHDKDGMKSVQFITNRLNSNQFPTTNWQKSVWGAEFKWKLKLPDIIYVWIKVIWNDDVLIGKTGPIPICTLDNISCNIGKAVHATIWEITNLQDDNNYNIDYGTFDSLNVPSTGSTTRRTTGSTTNTKTQRIALTNSIKHCMPTATKVPYRIVCSGELIFEDNFESFDESKWSHEVRGAHDRGDVEFMLYDGRVNIKNNQLEIKPILWSSYRPDIDVLNGKLDLGPRCTGQHNRRKECQLEAGGPRILPTVVAPRISTRNSFNFKYGRVEIRAKLPKGDWLNPLLLLEPLNEYYGHMAFESGQLRVAFARGNEQLNISGGKNIDGHILYGGPVLFLDANRRDEFMGSTRRNVHFGDDFHTYSLTWTPEHLVLEVDNQIYGQIQGGFSNISANDELLLNAWKIGSFMAPFDKEFYLTLGLSVGGFGDYPNNLFSGKHIKPWNNTDPRAQYNFWEHQQDWLPTWSNPELLVDYVRVYALRTDSQYLQG